MDLSVICKTCGQNTRYEDGADHVCINLNERARLQDQPRPIAAATRQPEPAPKTVQELEQEIREGKLTPEAERLGTLFVKAKLGSSTDGKTVTVKTGEKVSPDMQNFWNNKFSIIVAKDSNLRLFLFC